MDNGRKTIYTCGTYVHVSYYFDKLHSIITHKLAHSGVKVVLLKKTGDSISEFRIPALEDEEFASKIEIMYGDLPVLAKYRHSLTGLKWFHSGRNGVDFLIKQMTSEELESPPKYVLTRTLGFANAPIMTEYVVGQIIARERNFYDVIDDQRLRAWRPIDHGCLRNMSDITIGIMGVGDIGKYLAKTCKSFEMTVWGLDDVGSCPYVDEYRTQKDLAEFLGQCDYVINLLPSTERTRGLLSGHVLSSCRNKKCIFINVGRADIIDDESLLNALRSGWLGGAVLDVFNQEPLPTDSPLWTEPGVIVSPHVSGWSNTNKFFEHAAECFLENYRRYVHGEPLRGVVDWKHGY